MPKSEKITSKDVQRLGVYVNKNPYAHTGFLNSERGKNPKTTHDLGSFETTDAVLRHNFFSYLCEKGQSFLYLHGFKPREITELSIMLVRGRFRTFVITQVIHNNKREREEVLHNCEKLTDVLPILHYIYSRSQEGKRKQFAQDTYPELYTYQPEQSEEED